MYNAPVGAKSYMRIRLKNNKNTAKYYEAERRLL